MTTNKRKMSAIGRFWVRLKRIRHRRGYGVHSPFAFNFLTYVVYERGEYYAYRDLAARHPVPFFRCGGHLAKCRKFLFRLANYVHPAVIRLVGGIGTAEADYLSAGCRSAAVVRGGVGVAGQGAEVGVPRPKELVCVGRDVPPDEWAALVARPRAEDSACLIAGIHRSASSRQAWDEVKRQDAVVVSFDLYDYGLVFFDRSKQRQHYIIWF